ncbi:endonuclease/exonuclease/phosphatase family protein [Streptomyces sp. P38-E01]|uniref:Endonuclease/exonuclease/phosphatase family protein n=1 Tax=Streptomyces tardus TaxID=2780544 RepID=A0A949JNV5_9ACTN|nr:hypothetical protein [Streptomyces tardus]MBU7598546.1 endonuclease/exonuclease/phosphatase family protein [Streptomyces tardus]
MSRTRRAPLRGALAALALLAVSVSVSASAYGAGAGAAGTAAAGEASAADPLVVWNNNIENMLPVDCSDDYDFERLLTHLAKQSAAPDIFTVQQISDQGQLDELTARLTADLPGTYEGVIAIPEPGSMGRTSPCGKLKNQQTNAVVYRTERLTLKDETRWRSDAPTGGTGPCRNLTPTETSQDRVHNVGVLLHDSVAGKEVAVASIHWPTGTWNGPDCAAENVKEADEAVDRLGGDLRIVAGDANAKTSAAGWWQEGYDRGFRDPIAQLCGGPVCPPEHHTTANNRIDYILAKGGSGFSRAATVTEDVTGGAYSEHRAVTAQVAY